MTTATRAERATNERVELARYTISAGERVIYGQRIRGVVRFQQARGVVVVSRGGA